VSPILKTVIDYKHVVLQQDCKEFFIPFAAAPPLMLPLVDALGCHVASFGLPGERWWRFYAVVINATSFHL
jgi:hypothetical protein